MTSDKELERIEAAYRSGLKVQIWFDGYWYDYDSECRGFSKMRKYRIVGDAYAQKAEVHISELEKENAEYKEVFGSCDTCKRTCDIGNCCNPRTKNGYLLDKVKVIVERQKLLKENAELKEINTKTLAQLNLDNGELIIENEKLRKENAELKNRDCWKSCEYANPKSELIAQHIKDVQQLTKAKELLAKWVELFKPKGSNIPPTPIQIDTEQFLKDSEVEK